MVLYRSTYDTLRDVILREREYNQLKVDSIPYIQRIKNKKDSGELGITTSLIGIKL